MLPMGTKHWSSAELKVQQSRKKKHPDIFLFNVIINNM